jgi:hypothetical protein
MSSTMSPELQRGFEVLASGEWVSGLRLLNEMGTRVQPGPAERWMRARLTDPDAWSRDDLVSNGRRRLCQIRVSTMLERRRWETDPAELTKAHWQGEQPFKVRDRYPGAMTIKEAAQACGISRSLLDHWIAAGMVPPPTHLGGDGSVRSVLPATLAIYKQVAAIRPQPGKIRWDPDPRSLWKWNTRQYACPHCGGGFTITNSIAPVQPEQGNNVETEANSDSAATDLG